jgi:hypothetical protein
MVEASNRRNLEEIRRTVEASLRSMGDGADRAPLAPTESGAHAEDNATRSSGNNGEQPNAPADFIAAERIEKIGNASARAITEACETTATDIEKTGQLAVDVAAAIMKEANELAAGLRDKGDRMSEHLKEFAQLAKRVSITMRETRNEVASPTTNEEQHAGR